jgi:hypothetical protein
MEAWRDMTTMAERTQALTERILAEYRASPGLHLTRWQIQQIWRLDIAECDAVLQVLVLESGFLRLTPEGALSLNR